MVYYSVSVIICTVNRGHFLQYVMDAVSRWQYSFQELIVVVGPTFDDTEFVLSEYKSIIDKTIFIDQKNVSAARNLGLKAASGDIIFYLDDDVIPPDNWIEKHLQIHLQQGANCGCVGGAVIDKTKPLLSLQFDCGVNSLLSESRPVLSADTQHDYLSKPNWFRSIMGANASYKKEALVKIGYFDEFFEYFLEETDVCLRLQQAGYRICNVNAPVEHYVQPSHNRRDRQYLTCWYSLAKNTTYFALKHGFPRIYLPIFITRLTWLLIYRCLLRILRLKFTHNLSNYLLFQYIQDSIVGVRHGWKAGMKLYNTQPRKIAEVGIKSYSDKQLSLRTK